MHRRVVILGTVCSLSIQLGCPVFGFKSAGASAQEIGQYAVGAGLGLLLGSVLYRNTGASSPYYGPNSTQTQQPQPTVSYGYYWDGYSMSYGPIVTPPPGYVQPQQNLIQGTITDPYTGQQVPVLVNPVTGQTTIVSNPTTTTTPTTTTPTAPTPTTTTPTTITPTPTTKAPTTATTMRSTSPPSVAAINSARQQLRRMPAGFTAVRRPAQFSPMRSMLLSHAMQAASHGSNLLSRVGGRHF